MTFLRRYWLNKIYDTLNICNDEDKRLLTYHIETLKQSMNFIKYIINKNKEKLEGDSNNGINNEK